MYCPRLLSRGYQSIMNFSSQTSQMSSHLYRTTPYHLSYPLRTLCSYPVEKPPTPHPRLASSSSSLPSSSLFPGLRFGGRRVSPRKVTPTLNLPGRDAWSVVGYSTAEGYSLIQLRDRIKEQDLYEIHSLGDELYPICIHARAKYTLNGEEEPLDGKKGEEEGSVQSKDIFFFAEGSVIFWNVPQLERDNVLNFLRPMEFTGYPVETIFEESEMMNYKLSNEQSRIVKGVISLNSQNLTLEKYSFSNAIAASVKLGALEANLDRIIDSIEHISEDMKRGRSVKMDRHEVLKKTGEIFALRHALNLSSDLLDTPDFYWDRESLELLYHSTCAHLTIGKRTRVMNEKLTHCAELVDLITNHLNDEHHVRLEWFIIILIMIEVGFELMHFAERFM